MADIINLTSPRQDFPVLAIPVFQTISTTRSLLSTNSCISENFQLDQKLGFLGVNIVDNGPVLFHGPARILSEAVGYNRMVGLDDVEIYMGVEGFNPFQEISEKGFPVIGPLYAETDKIEREIVDFGIGFKGQNFTSAFELGNTISTKFGFRKGDRIDFYGKRNVYGKGYVGVMVLEPYKRDYDAVVAAVFEAETKDALAVEMLEYKIGYDPSNEDNYITHVSIIEVGPAEKYTCGFILVNPYVTAFTYDAKCLIAGVTKHSHPEKEE